MSWWNEKAAKLQRGVRSDEWDQQGHDYDDTQVRRATVHSREDIVLLVGLLDAANAQLRTIKLLLAALVLLVLYVALAG